MVMDQKIYHGNVTPIDIATILLAHFEEENLEAVEVGLDDQIIVQIRSKKHVKSGGKTAIAVTLQQFDDGVIVSVGEQKWLNIAASLGYSALVALKNPFSLLHRIDDIAQDLENLRIKEEIWQVINSYTKSIKSGFQLSERLRRIVCEYCLSSNPVNESNCQACGAPLGGVQPSTCNNCGYILTHADDICPNCKYSML